MQIRVLQSGKTSWQTSTTCHNSRRPGKFLWATAIGQRPKNSWQQTYTVLGSGMARRYEKVSFLLVLMSLPSRLREIHDLIVTRNACLFGTLHGIVRFRLLCFWRPCVDMNMHGLGKWKWSWACRWETAFRTVLRFSCTSLANQFGADESYNMLLDDSVDSVVSSWFAFLPGTCTRYGYVPASTSPAICQQPQPMSSWPWSR